MARPRVADKGDVHKIWRVAPNIGQQTVRGPPAWGLGGELKHSNVKRIVCYETLHTPSSQDGVFGTA
jgi:hypothetical protein